MTSYSRTIARFLALLMLWALCGLAGAADTPAGLVTEKLAVGGAVEQSLNLTLDDLRKFPSQQIAEITITRQSGADAGKLQNVKGVRLRDIIDQAKIVTHDHNDVKKMVIVASASDGYKAVFSWNELFNSSIGDGVIVYFEKNGKPLGDDEGRIALISSQDTRTGPRHVKWLQSIEVKKIAD